MSEGFCKLLYDAPRFGLDAVFIPLLSDGRGRARDLLGVKLDITVAFYCFGSIVPPDPVARSLLGSDNWSLWVNQVQQLIEAIKSVIIQ